MGVCVSDNKNTNHPEKTDISSSRSFSSRNSSFSSNNEVTTTNPTNKLISYKRDCDIDLSTSPGSPDIINPLKENLADMQFFFKQEIDKIFSTYDQKIQQYRQEKMEKIKREKIFKGDRKSIIKVKRKKRARSMIPHKMEEQLKQIRKKNRNKNLKRKSQPMIQNHKRRDSWPLTSDSNSSLKRLLISMNNLDFLNDDNNNNNNKKKKNNNKKKHKESNSNIRDGREGENNHKEDDNENFSNVTNEKETVKRVIKMMSDKNIQFYKSNLFQQRFEKLSNLERSFVGKTISDFKVIKRIGGRDVGLSAVTKLNLYGSSSYIYEVEYEKERYALKVLINLGHKNTTMVKQKLLEREFRKFTHHKNIIRILYAFKEDVKTGILPDWDFDENYVIKKTAVFLMPLYDKNLKQWRNVKEFFSEIEILKLMKQVLSGLCFLHKNMIVNCDIKPDNILISDELKLFKMSSSVVIGDFGMSLDFSKFEGFKISYPQPFVQGGAIFYQPPEIQNTIPGPDAYLNYDKYDIFSFGVVVYELMCTKGDEHPWGEKNKTQENFIYLKDFRYSEDLKDLIEEMLYEDVERRISCYKCSKRVSFLLKKNMNSKEQEY